MNRQTRKMILRRLPSLLLVAVMAVLASMAVLCGELQLTAIITLVGMAYAGASHRSLSMAGIAFSNAAVANSTFDGQVTYQIALPAGNAVTGWTKTDNDTASCTLAGGHGQTNGKYDVYWIESSVQKVRYGLDGTISTNTLTLDGGAGDNFPATSTTGVVCTKQVSSVVNIDGDNVVLFGIFLKCPLDTAAVAHADLQDSGDATIEEFDLTEADNTVNGTQHIYQQTAARALLTGNPITSCKASNGSATAAAVLHILCGVDA